MTVNTTTINGDVFLPSGAVREKSFVIFEMTGFDTDADDGAVVVNFPIRAPISDDGSINQELWPNQEGVRSTFYKVTIEVYNGTTPHYVCAGKIEVPASGGAYALNNLLPVVPPEGADVDQYIASLAASVASAENAADRAEAAAELVGGVSYGTRFTITITEDNGGRGPYPLPNGVSNPEQLTVHLNKLTLQPIQDYTVVENGGSYEILFNQDVFVGSDVWGQAAAASFGNSTGADGLSAYEVAVSEGFVGNESDWLASLAGLDGEGWTGATYDAGTGAITFTSMDGLGFTTGDLRGADGVDGREVEVSVSGTLLQSRVGDEPFSTLIDLGNLTVDNSKSLGGLAATEYARLGIANSFTQHQEIARTAARLQVNDTETGTAMRVVSVGGYGYIQVGADGAGPATSSGRMRLTGFNGANLDDLEARVDGLWEKVIHTGNLGSYVVPTGSDDTFPTRADFVAENPTHDDGFTVIAGGLHYQAVSSATVISDLAGWIPVDPQPDHWNEGDTQASLVAAVAYCFANGEALHWVGDYTSTATIPNLHNIRHTGRGTITRGGDVFYPAPVGEDPNTIYVSTTGTASNDGLSEDQPTTYGAVRGILGNYGPIVGGTWAVEVAAGTYTGFGTFAIRLGPDNENETLPDEDQLSRDHLWFANYLTIKGPDVGYDPVTDPEPLPTAIFDREGGSASIFDFRGGVRTYVKDIHFKNADGSASSNGVLCTNGALRCENVHTTDCTYGISGLESCLLEVKGGGVTGTAAAGNANTGIRSLFHTKHDIGNQGAGATGQGPFIRKCNIGFFAQEMASGHSDHVTYEDCDWGVRCRVNSRVNTNGSTFARCNVGMRADSGSVIGLNGNEEFFIGTADATTTPYDTSDGSIAYFGSEASDHFSYPLVSKRVLNGTGYSEITGTVAEQAAEVLTLPTGAVLTSSGGVNQGKVLKVRATGVITGSAGTKTFRLRLGPVGGVQTTYAGATVAADGTGSFVYDAELVVKNDSSQVSFGSVSTSFGSGDNQGIGSYTSSTSLDVDAAFTLTVAATLGAAGDSIQFHHISIETMGII